MYIKSYDKSYAIGAAEVMEHQAYHVGRDALIPPDW